MVCFDDDRIHGIQLTLTMHRWEFENEKDLLADTEFAQMIQDIDEMIETSTPRKMSLIGSLSNNCERFLFDGMIEKIGV